jgi:hypothetical protein
VPSRWNSISTPAPSPNPLAATLFYRTIYKLQKIFNHMKKLLPMVCALITMLFLGCKKSDTVTKASQVGLLTNVHWIITNEERYSNGAWAQDTTFAKQRSCNFDDYMLFTTDYNYEHNFGAVQCDSTRPVYSFSGIWSVSEDNPNKILFNNALEADIDKLDKNNFQYTFPYSYRYTLSH